MTDEADEMSAASRGSHGPDAWAVLLPGKEKRLRLTRQEAEDHLEFWLHNHQIRSADDGKMIPLFAVSEAEIDALEYVVVEGRIACKQDYGVLRSLLVRLRPEWAKSGNLGLRPEEGDPRDGSLDGCEKVQ